MFVAFPLDIGFKIKIQGRSRLIPSLVRAYEQGRQFDTDADTDTDVDTDTDADSGTE
jgi:hypothetical protein